MLRTLRTKRSLKINKKRKSGLLSKTLHRRRIINLRRFSTTNAANSYMNIQYVDNHIAVMQMNRPKVNAMDTKFFGDMIQALKTIESNKQIKGLILTGLPGIYSAGLDVPYLLTLSKEDLMEWYKLFVEAMKGFCGTRLATIAAISGHSPAGGCVFSILCDYRIMVKGPFSIGLNEVRVGIVIPQSIIDMIRNTIGYRKAELQALTGKLYSTEEALNIGLVDELVEPNQLIPQALNVMNKTFIPVYSHAFVGTKKNLRKIYIDGLEKQKTDQQFVNLFFEPTFRQKLEAFVESLKKK